jgi:fructose/tagatose bisphosphate aldolase
MSNELNELLSLIENSLGVEGHTVKVTDAAKFRALVGKLVEVSALESGSRQGWARYLIRSAALALGIYPASINELYLARGRGEVPLTFTYPAFNLRTLSFHSARAAFRMLIKLNAASCLFEIARSEVGYTAQRPAEYSTNIFSAAIAEGYSGPVFLQGDHFQVSAKRYASEREVELQAVRDLTKEAIAAGFFNIDVDTSTLVDISKADVKDQQKLNVELSAMFSSYIRSIEPNGVTVSIGGEIGEVGGHNSTEPELRTYLGGYNAELQRIHAGAVGLSKISIQTGTSHGGTVLPDGSIAKVAVDFDILRDLSRVSRADYGLSGTVQHGASTLPEENFGKFVESEASEVHLATNFMNMFFDHIPAEFRREMYVWVDKNSASERKPGMTDEQFYYKARKNSVGPFKAQMYALPQAVKDELNAAWEDQFFRLFSLLGMKDSRQYVDQFIKPVTIHPKLGNYLGKAAGDESVDDLAD